MAYTLEITFTGLFSFVPHEAENKLYVLLPTSNDTAHHHVPELRHRKLTNPPHTFRREHLRLDGIPPGVDTTIAVPQEAMDLSQVTGQRLPVSQVVGVPTDRVRLRIELPPANTIVSGPPTQWRLHGTRRLSHKIIWTRTGLALPDITFMRSLLDGGPESPLSFQPQGAKMRLFFRHLPHHDICLDVDEPAEHFSLYYSLYVPPVNGPNPVLDEPPPFPCPSFAARRRPKSRRAPLAANTFTCMTSQG